MKSKEKEYGWGIAVVFILVMLSFVFDVWSTKREIISHPLAEQKSFNKKPVRNPKLEPFIIHEGHKYNCNDCHQNLESSKVQKSFFSAHSDIILNHGVNNHCMTCHNSKDLERLIDVNENEVLFSQSQNSCLQCHGPIYRDWKNGAHGRMNDFWDKQKGDVRKLTCVSCHDPHQPKFKSMKPAPAPKIQNYRKSVEELKTKEDHHE